MLILDIKVGESYDENSQRFIPKTIPVAFEHSLLSLSKWEEKYEKPFLSQTEQLSEDEVLDYLHMMIVNPFVDTKLLNYLSSDNYKEIQEYLNKKATATTVREDKATPGPKPIVTSELIYYWMFSLQIPKECETWHINRLLMLIKVFNAKQQEADPKNKRKMSRSEIMARNRALNAKRLAGGKKG